MAQATPFPQDRTCPYHPPTGYRPLSEQGPLNRVTLYDDTEAWLVTGHAEAQALLTDPRLSADRQNPAFPLIARRFELSRREPIALLGVDDPLHNKQRRTLIPTFGVKRVAAMRPRIQRVVDELLDAVVAQGPPVELVAAFALPVPSIVICELLGVPYADHDFFEDASRRILRSATAQESDAGRLELMDYLGDLVDRKAKAAHGDPAGARAAAPAADATPEGVLDELVRDRLSDGTLDREELVRLALILLVAGHETTANMISLGTFTLLEHPDQLGALRADPELTRDAVEELLRYLSIADGLVRVATEDIEVAGQTIRADDGVILSSATVNRDATVYSDADDLDVRRNARHHLAFGFGIHQCLGQNLARAELEIALHSLLTRLPDLRLAVPAHELRMKPGDTIQGLVELPVTWGRG
ncbi:cytochrome P450 [Streptomyces aurantiacus]|uniref:Putative Cytochrome-SOY n=1 Tax=Streptomyces aurantiacus JA 4570 TaxID=1286094 RepID=S3ZCF2_9ACTN|nr:cytochrome P450 [Streptomyces aurantiacus]EPH40808.1 putative Cytochrome-SOY [Streptomyces aurantiacus JA 4570]